MLKAKAILHLLTHDHHPRSWVTLDMFNNLDMVSIDCIYILPHVPQGR